MENGKLRMENVLWLRMTLVAFEQEAELQLFFVAFVAELLLC